MQSFEGIAQNAKMGAVINGMYVDGLDEWPTDVVGKRVRVSGVVVKHRHAPVATIAADGAISQGVTDDALDTCLRDARWELVQGTN